MASISDPIKVGNKWMKNRIAFAPTVKFGWMEEDGKAGPRFAAHYGARAKAGTGLIVVEATCVSREGRLWSAQLGLWEDTQIEGHRGIVESCHEHGALVLVQIHHGGLGQHPVNGELVAPSDSIYQNRMARALKVEEIHTIREQFIQSAVRAQKAGYDGVQFHACHSYLLNNFASPLWNRRDDLYGGSTENRTRLACEIIRGIRNACGPEFIIAIRMGGAEPTIEEGCRIADYYINAGADLLQVSNGMGGMKLQKPDSFPYSEICWMGTEIHKHVKGRVPVAVVNSILKPETARELVSEGLTDIVDSARALLADPEWSSAVLHDTPHTPCYQCKPRCRWGPVTTQKCPALTKRQQQDPQCAE